jgi:hypothetical protein
MPARAGGDKDNLAGRVADRVARKLVASETPIVR